jgi:hypothetical protein
MFFCWDQAAQLFIYTVGGEDELGVYGLVCTIASNLVGARDMNQVIITKAINLENIE